MTNPKQVLIVGGGHNGLVCAAYLAKGGHKVTVLEAADQVGGAAVTSELGEGFAVPACAHLLYQLDPKLMRDLQLEKHGLALAAADLDTVVLSQSDRPLKIAGSVVVGGDATDADKGALPEFDRQMSEFAQVLWRFLSKKPPRLANSSWSDKLTLLEWGLSVRRMGRDSMREFLRVVGMNMFDLLEEHFESNLLKGAKALDAVLGTHLGPRSPNSVLTYLYRHAVRSGGRHGAVAVPKGGMGSVGTALAKSAESFGASIRTGALVRQILLTEAGVSGVELDGGEVIPADIVVSNADPKTTFLELVGAANLEVQFVRRIHNIRMRGNAAKLNLTLDGLPSFRGLERHDLAGRLLIAPSVPYVERAFDHAKYGEYSEAPAMEIVLPSMHDANLAPSGKHVLSAIVQYAPYRLKEGWDEGRAPFTKRVIETLASFAPDIEDRIIATQMLTPADIEREFRITGGHWHHGELALDQFLMLRPVPGAAQYAAPVNGLYLCGAGSHPGGGIMGVAGRLAAAEVLAGRTRT